MKNGFWQTKTLENFSKDEWESVCCHCGRCCLIKLQNEANDDIFYTRVICHYFDVDKKQCTVYEKRCSLVPECLKITPKNIDELTWMPQGCAYRILNETGDLPEEHPLKGGKYQPCLPENLVKDNMIAEEDLENYIVEDEVF